MLIALYERAVAFYAELVNINAFHQPGVEAYKKISESINQLSVSVQQFICENSEFSGSSTDYANEMNEAGLEEEIAGILAKYCLNNRTFGEHSLSREFNGDTWIYTIG